MAIDPNAGDGAAGKFVELNPGLEVGMVRVEIEAVTARVISGRAALAG